MTAKKHPVPSYLDDHEIELLKKISLKWGCSYSAAIKRLIREESVNQNA